MTTNVLRLPGEYQIQTNSNGRITLDTGVGTGTVVVTGSLDVRGTTTVVQATNASIKDNTLVLNAGETNSYVTLETSGIIIDRGFGANLSNAATLLYNDQVGIDGFSWHTTDIAQRGIFEFKVAGNVSAIRANAIRIDTATAPKVSGFPTLNFFGSDNTTALLSVAGSGDYAARVSASLDDNIIPNKKYVDLQVQNAASSANISRVFQGNTEMVIEDISTTGQPSIIKFGFTPGLYNVTFSENDVIFPGMIFTQNTITARGSNADLYLEPTGTGTINVRKALRLTDQATPPVANTNTTALYTTGVVGPGGTGIYYVNKDTSGEFISRKKAIIYGLIF